MNRNGSKSDVEFIHEAEQLDEAYPHIGQAVATVKGLDHKSYRAHLDEMREAKHEADRIENERQQVTTRKRKARAGLGAFMKRVRAAVVGHYGDDSDEVARVGLTPASQRKRPGRKPASPKTA